MKVVELALLLSLALTGCSTTTLLSEKDRQGLQSISVSTEVPWTTGPPQVSADRREADPLVMGLFGPFVYLPLVVGTAISNKTDDKARAERTAFALHFSDYLAENKIDIRELIREAFEAELLRMRAFPAVVPREQAQAHFVLRIGIWELKSLWEDRAEGRLRPVLLVEGSLQDTKDKLLWQKVGFVNMRREPWERGYDETKEHQIPAYRVAEYAADPALAKEVFRQAAQVMASVLLKEMGPR
jgi:hypothetical protein